MKIAGNYNPLPQLLAPPRRSVSFQGGADLPSQPNLGPYAPTFFDLLKQPFETLTPLADALIRPFQEMANVFFPNN